MTNDRRSEFSRVLVTGAGGFVGSSLCAALAERGWQVIAASRRPMAAGLAHGTVNMCLPLLSNEAQWQSALKSVHCVVHLAAHVHVMGPSGGAEAAFHEINVRGTAFVAEQAERASVRRIVFVSTVKVNGEGGAARYRAEDVPHPSDAYARSKFEAEQVLHALSRRSGVETAIVRPPLIYGPGVGANFRRLMQLADRGVPLPLGSIDNRRSLVSIWNLNDFIEVCMTHPDADGETWLVSDGQDVSTPELMRKIARLMGRRDRLFAFPPALLRWMAGIAGMGGEMSRLCDSLTVDSTPAAERLRWKPAVALDEGLARTVRAFHLGRPR
jgi:nucleoside-diphosphate-sugar epimerase